MTKKELNRDIKRLQKFNHELSLKKEMSTNCYYQHRDKLDAEFLRLYRADKEFNSMNLNSIRFMIAYNFKERVIPFKIFGSNININGGL